ncbi:hypothetical protein ElyMa_001549500 [Elysia marginata]|uniref:Spaetzle domain-containing protein n=1 Tax=Elysia marginata TaxID=1093978 RepID=A0AAV4JD58_9GAST|nr:hypothetical protein ElyMa_001549500 [Elysia marginata]
MGPLWCWGQAKAIIRSVLPALVVLGSLYFLETEADTAGFTRDEITDLVRKAFENRMKATAQSQPTLPSNSWRKPGRSKRSPFYHYECPVQSDQSKVYNLGSDPTGYPIQPISDELFVRSLPGSDTLFQCLAREVLQPEKDPSLEQQPLLEQGNVCPQELSQLWTYNSVVYGNQLCWVLANFQEDIFFSANCSGVPCKGCDDFFRSSFDDTQKICYPRYRTVSLWGFCPGLAQNTRLVRDRIIIPADCSCTSVTCIRTGRFPFHWK